LELTIENDSVEHKKLTNCATKLENELRMLSLEKEKKS